MTALLVAVVDLHDGVDARRLLVEGVAAATTHLVRKTGVTVIMIVETVATDPVAPMTGQLPVTMSPVNKADIHYQRSRNEG